MSPNDHTPEQWRKAEDLLRIDGAVTQDEANPFVWWVRPRSGVCYRVQRLPLAPGNVLWGCSCAHGRHEGRSAYCYHIAAVKGAQRGVGGFGGRT